MSKEKKNTKSRTGCLTCKRRRLKCDETKPQCNNCINKGIECGGYATTFKWKSYQDTSSVSGSIARVQKPQKLNNERARSMSMPESTIITHALELATLSVTGKTFQDLEKQNQLMAMGKNPYSVNHLEQKVMPDPKQRSLPINKLSPISLSPPPIVSPSYSSLVKAFTDFDSMNIPSPLLLNSEHNDSAIEDDKNDDHLEVSSMKRSQSFESIFYDASIPEYRQELLNFSQSFHNVGNSSTYLIPLTPPLTTSRKLSTEADKIFEAFDNYTCGIISIKNGPTENPWRTMIWPLALKNSVLFKTIASMSLFHIARDDSEIRKLAISYMKQAIQELALGLSDDSIPNNIALVVCLILSMTESWDKQISTGIAHLRGAKSIILKKIKDIKSGKEHNDQYDLEMFKFLCNIFIYNDVIARVTSFQLTDSTIYDKKGEFVQILTNWIDSEDEGSRINIDPLLGCAKGLFLIFGRVTSFINSRVRKSNKLSLSMISTAVELKTELENWKPKNSSFANIKFEDPYCDLASCLATAEAYRYSALLYLHQAVSEIPSMSSKDLSQKILKLLASIPMNSRTMIIHIFPLLIASCEVDDEEDRDWVRQRWQLFSSRMWIGNIDKAYDVVKEVWRRKDMLKANKTNQKLDVCGTIQNKMKALTNEEREDDGVNSWTHWSSIMREWGWEVLLG